MAENARPLRRPPNSITTTTSTSTTATATRPRTRAPKTKAETEIDQRQRISLSGSTAIVSDYFHYALNAILFQRSIYDQNDFKMVKKFGLQMMLVEDEGLVSYLDRINKQLKNWLMAGKLKRLVLVIINKETGETVERWEFDVTLEDEQSGQIELPSTTAEPTADSHKKKKKPKTMTEIQNEIQAIVRQITASVSFLPIYHFPRTFKVLAYTHQVSDNGETDEWKDSEAYDLGQEAETVKLKSFSTSVHRVDTAVQYKMGEALV